MHVNAVTVMEPIVIFSFITMKTLIWVLCRATALENTPNLNEFADKNKANKYY